MMANDVRYIANKIKQDMDYNTITYAFKNPMTDENQPFLRGHGLSYVLKGKENKKPEHLWISNSQALRAIAASHYSIDGTFDTVPKGFLQKLVIMMNNSITNHPKPLAYIYFTHKQG